MICPHCGKAIRYRRMGEFELTQIEHDIYQYILAYGRDFNEAPTLVQIGSVIGCAKSTVHRVLRRLQSKKYLKIGPGQKNIQLPIGIPE